MAMTLRLPHDLAQRGRRYAAELGISLNGLLAVALRDYLDARKRESRTPALPPTQALAQAVARQVKAGPLRRRT
jgi:predicted transcriptional regulator